MTDNTVILRYWRMNILFIEVILFLFVARETEFATTLFYFEGCGEAGYVNGH